LGTEARARVSLVALLVLTLFTFGQVFDATDYVGPALLAIGIATAVAILLRRIGLSSMPATAISLGLMMLYLILVFAPHQTLYGLPTMGAVERLWRTITRALEASRTDYAPVPMRTGYVVLIVAGMWLAATFAEVAAFRWKRPLLATLLPMTMFCLVMVVGTQEAASFSVSLFLAILLTFWALEASHRMRSWGRGISAWSHRGMEDVEAPSVTGSLARRMGAATIVVAIVSPLILPAFGDGLLAWRTQIGEGPGGAGAGGSGSGRINQLVSIAPQLISQSDQVLFDVESDQTAYWRLVSLADFDGRDWHPLAGSDDGQGLPLLPPEAPVQRVQQRFNLTSLEGDQLPAAVQANVAFIDFRTSDPRFDETRLLAQRDGSLRLLDAFEDEAGDVRGLSYDVTSFAPAISYADLRDAAPATPAPAYADVPSDLSDEVKELVRGWVDGAQTPLDKLIAIQDELRSFEYSLDVERLASTDYLTRFLLETQAGYCQQFATAFAILARFEGFATRVSVGFLPGEQDPGRRGRFTVRGTDAHAWPEVYFRDVGWVPFEPTPRSATTPPRYTIPGAGFTPGVGSDGGFSVNPGGPGGAGGTLRGSLGEVRRGGACEGGQSRGCSGVTEAGGGELRPAPAPGPRGPTVWEGAFERLATAILIAVVLFLIAMPLLKRWRTVSRYRVAADAQALAAAAFAEFESEAGELASPRSPSESPASYAVRIATMARVPRRTAAKLADLYEQAAYSSTGVSSSQAEQARDLARDLKGRLWSTSSWWERAIRLFSPGGLRTS
jgi:transglutaminase-like putative cysteine protease